MQTLSPLTVMEQEKKNHPKFQGTRKIKKKKFTGNIQECTTIAKKNQIPYKIYDTFLSDWNVRQIEAPFIIVTIYQPRARPYLPTPDFLQLFRRNIPVYIHVR